MIPKYLLNITNIRSIFTNKIRNAKASNGIDILTYVGFYAKGISYPWSFQKSVSPGLLAFIKKIVPNYLSIVA